METVSIAARTATSDTAGVSIASTVSHTPARVATRRNRSALIVSTVMLAVALVPFVLSLMLPGLVSGSHLLWVTPVAWGSLVALAAIAVVMSARAGDAEPADQLS